MAAVAAIAIMGLAAAVASLTATAGQFRAVSYGGGISECEVITVWNGSSYGDTVCENYGYDVCAYVDLIVSRNFYNSSDGSCSNPLQLTDQFSTGLACDVYVILDSGDLGDSCKTNINSVFGEPMYGDWKDTSEGMNVVCCK